MRDIKSTARPHTERPRRGGGGDIEARRMCGSARTRHTIDQTGPKHEKPPHARTHARTHAVHIQARVCVRREPAGREGLPMPAVCTVTVQRWPHVANLLLETRLWRRTMHISSHSVPAAGHGDNEIRNHTLRSDARQGVTRLTRRRAGVRRQYQQRLRRSDERRASSGRTDAERLDNACSCRRHAVPRLMGPQSRPTLPSSGSS
ncbi:hypothetical protein K466DRAFT_157427 [Polyporus arcularius HHB13444]|uniref:Uncharacterized protein n=1 Tax=Polyporus arcularius HHB13444 TaxID=1314778 RepID=A0A5C3PBG7_9APHY|nr:hypothetical protein K466DRAFT_157427 [Polyporus arcularius HHB13444]